MILALMSAQFIDWILLKNWLNLDKNSMEEKPFLQNLQCQLNAQEHLKKYCIFGLTNGVKNDCQSKFNFLRQML